MYVFSCVNLIIKGPDLLVNLLHVCTCVTTICNSELGFNSLSANYDVF